MNNENTTVSESNVTGAKKNSELETNQSANDPKKKKRKKTRKIEGAQPENEDFVGGIVGGGGLAKTSEHHIAPQVVKTAHQMEHNEALEKPSVPVITEPVLIATGIHSGGHSHHQRLDASGFGGAGTATVTGGDSPVITTAVSTSPHGNVANAIPSTITVDTLIDKTTVDITDGGNADNVINAVESTHAKVTGTIDPTATLTKLEVTDANGHVVTIDAKHVTVTNGHFTATGVDVHGLADGQLTVTAIAVDPAGNISNTATDSITLDTQIHATDDKATVAEGGGIIHGLVLNNDDHDGTHITHTLNQVGNHGTYLINPDGTYSYTLNNADVTVQGLAAGQTITDTITYEVTDRAGNTTTASLTTTITGTNDAPRLNAIMPRNANEDGLIISGRVTANDVDHGDTKTYSIGSIIESIHHGVQGGYTANPNKDGSYTTTEGFTLNKDGTYSFDPKNPAIHAIFNHLAAADPDGHYSATSATIKIPIVVTDSQGATATETLEITLHGENDPAKIHVGFTVGYSLDVYEDKKFGSLGHDWLEMSPTHHHPLTHLLNHGDTLQTEFTSYVVDPDSGQSHLCLISGVQGTIIQGKYGKFRQFNNGLIDYILDVGPGKVGEAVDALGEGETLIDVISVQSMDHIQKRLTVTIHGSNDSPYCTAGLTLVEHQGHIITTAELLKNSVDVDHNDQGLLHIAGLTAAHGTITINHKAADGNDHTKDTFTYLPNAGFIGKETFTYHVQDGHVDASYSPMGYGLSGDTLTSATMMITNDTHVYITDGAKGNHNNVIDQISETFAAEINGHINPGTTLKTLTITDAHGHSHTIDPKTVTIDAHGDFKVKNVDVSSLDKGTLTVHAESSSLTGVNPLSSASILLKADVLARDDFVHVQVDPAYGGWHFETSVLMGNVFDNDKAKALVAQPILNRVGKYGLFNMSSSGVFTYQLFTGQSGHTAEKALIATAETDFIYYAKMSKAGHPIPAPLTDTMTYQVHDNQGRTQMVTLTVVIGDTGDKTGVYPVETIPVLGHVTGGTGVFGYIHDQALTTEELNQQIDVDLADTQHHIDALQHDIANLVAQGENSDDEKAKLDSFTDDKADLQAEREALLHSHPTPAVVLHDANEDASAASEEKQEASILEINDADTLISAGQAPAAPMIFLDTIKAMSTEIVPEKTPAMSEHTAALIHAIGGDQMVQDAHDQQTARGETPALTHADLAHQQGVNPYDPASQADHDQLQDHVDIHHDVASLREDLTPDDTHHIDLTHHHY
ncbi:VCBS domain-containing protein [Vibrio splendidus]|uniref:VCBS domain-containing protein n=1 Tax=Vibrio splendidus TaxID=29497 RepID=UPI003D0AE779